MLTEVQMDKVKRLTEARLALNSTGYPGIRLVKGRWQGRVKVNGRRLQSRGFFTPEEAQDWRASQIVHGAERRVIRKAKEKALKAVERAQQAPLGISGPDTLAL